MRLARFVLTVMEGGLMQARAAGDLKPFDESVAELRGYFSLLEQRAARVDQALEDRGARSRRAQTRVAQSHTERSNAGTWAARMLAVAEKAEVASRSS